MNETEQKRGELTQRIIDRASELMPHPITRTELRLMTYIMYVMLNDQRIDPRKVNDDERIILRKWREAGYMEGGASGMTITREFWDIMCDLVFLGYVDIDDDAAAERKEQQDG